MNVYDQFAMRVAEGHDAYLLDAGPEDQGPHAAGLLARFHRNTPLTLVTGTVIDLASFGEAPVHFRSADTEYLLLSEIAAPLDWPLYKAHTWAELQHSHALADQRREDEERGDGRLGWYYMRDYVDLGFFMTMPDPEAKPDAGGQRWSHAGDWLISRGRLPWLLACSPCGKKFVDNTIDDWTHSMRDIHGDSAPFRTDVTREEARRKTRLGRGLQLLRGEGR
jgi:hypothetical protein